MSRGEHFRGCFRLCYHLALAPGAEVMTEESKSFTVKDRRHFTSDGRAREPEDAETAPPPSPEEPSPPAVPGAQAPAAAASLPDEADPAASAAGASPADDAGPAAAAGESPGSGPAVDFAQFLLSLGTQASLLLSGQIEGASPAQALGEARSMIGILEMLRDKTEGRRTPREDQILEGLLYELRMAYVARARETGA